RQPRGVAADLLLEALGDALLDLLLPEGLKRGHPAAGVCARRALPRGVGYDRVGQTRRPPRPSPMEGLRPGAMIKHISGSDAVTAPVELHSVVPQELSLGLGRDRRPPEDRLDRLREPTLRVRIVGAEHQRVRAEQLGDAPYGALAFVHLDALKILGAAD